MSTNQIDIEKLNADSLRNHIENLAKSYQELINKENEIYNPDKIDSKQYEVHIEKMQSNYKQLRDSIVQYNTKKYGDISEQTFPNLLSLKDSTNVKLYTPEYKDLSPASVPQRVITPSTTSSDLDSLFDSESDTSSSRRNSMEMSLDEINELLNPTSPRQSNEKPVLNILVESIKNELPRLKRRLEMGKESIVLMNQVTERGETLENFTIALYNENNKHLEDIAKKLAEQLQKCTPEELELIKKQTNNFDNIGTYDGQHFLIQSAEKLSEKTLSKLQEIRQKQLNQFVEQIKREKSYLGDTAKELHHSALKLDEQLKNNNNNVNKLDTTILNRVKTLNTYLRKTIDEYNKKLDELNPSNQEMDNIASKLGSSTSELINNRIPYPRFINTQLENLLNPIPITSHTQTPLEQSPPITPPNQTPLKPNTETVPPQNQNGNASVNLSGKLISNDWVHNKELAKKITQVMEDALKNDPYFKTMNLQYDVKKIDLSTPQNPSSGLKGLEVTSKDPNKTISFIATPESVSGNGNTENLKAMSIEIVKNLETRISMGASGLKINLGDCEPESVKKEFSELINTQLKEMLNRNQNNPKFSGYSMEKLQLPVTPITTANAVITPTNQTNNTQQTHQRMGSPSQ